MIHAASPLSHCARNVQVPKQRCPLEQPGMLTAEPVLVSPWMGCDPSVSAQLQRSHSMSLCHNPTISERLKTQSEEPNRREHVNCKLTWLENSHSLFRLLGTCDTACCLPDQQTPVCCSSQWSLSIRRTARRAIPLSLQLGHNL